MNLIAFLIFIAGLLLLALHSSCKLPRRIFLPNSRLRRILDRFQ